MIKIEINKQINEAKLLDELLKNRLIEPVNEDGTSTVTTEFVYVANEENVNEVQQIIDVHDPAPLPQQPTSEQQLTMEMTMAMAQMQMDNMMAIAELTNLIMAMGGM